MRDACEFWPLLSASVSGGVSGGLSGAVSAPGLVGVGVMSGRVSGAVSAPVSGGGSASVSGWMSGRVFVVASFLSGRLSVPASGSLFGRGTGRGVACGVPGRRGWVSVPGWLPGAGSVGSRGWPGSGLTRWGRCGGPVVRSVGAGSRLGMLTMGCLFLGCRALVELGEWVEVSRAAGGTRHVGGGRARRMAAGCRRRVPTREVSRRAGDDGSAVVGRARVPVVQVGGDGPAGHGRVSEPAWLGCPSA